MHFQHRETELQLYLLEPHSDSGIFFCSVGLPHTVVVYPACTEDVVKVVKIANKYRMPVIPYSGATSIEGQFLGVRSSTGSDTITVVSHA